MSHSFDPQDWSHWLLVAAYLLMSLWILKAVYFN